MSDPWPEQSARKHELPRSRLVTGAAIPEHGEAPLLVAHGDPDDHLRMTVLLADVLGASTRGELAREAVERCKSPTNVTWRRRLDDLSYLLEHAALPEDRRYAGVLVDIDALDAGPADEEWDDRDFRRQRGELLQVVLDAVAEGGWLVVRTNPSSPIIRPEDLALFADEAVVPPSEPMRVLSAEGRPILSWILQSGTLTKRDVERFFEAAGPDGFEQGMVGLVYEAIPAYARRAAKQLTALRGFQTHNAKLGPLELPAWGDFGPIERRNADAALRAGRPVLEPRAVTCLEQCGFLQPGPARDGHRTLRMPRAVRTYVRVLAQLGDPETLELEHKAWGALPLDGRALSDQLETHYHAVQGGELEHALRTARYYATDLRALAFRLSHQEEYDRAASVYRTIVDTFDPEDAYAWEYLAFNLALAGRHERLPDERAAEIQGAYEKAFELDRNNPLYHGRLLGFRAEREEDVSIEFHRGMAKYVRRHRENSPAVSYFAEPVLQGMMRGRWGRQRLHVIQPWRQVFEQHPKLRKLMGDAS